jgi:hypothetical protein
VKEAQDRGTVLSVYAVAEEVYWTHVADDVGAGDIAERLTAVASAWGVAVELNQEDAARLLFALPVLVAH